MDELKKLEQEIAYSAARSDIECWCMGQKHGGPHHGLWYDIESAESGEQQEYVTMAVRYLELRGLLKHHPDNASLVRPMDN